MHSRFCRTTQRRAVHRTLEPETTLKPLMRSFTAEIVAQFDPGFRWSCEYGDHLAQKIRAERSSNALRWLTSLLGFHAEHSSNASSDPASDEQSELRVCQIADRAIVERPLLYSFAGGTHSDIVDLLLRLFRARKPSVAKRTRFCMALSSHAAIRLWWSLSTCRSCELALLGVPRPYAGDRVLQCEELKRSLIENAGTPRQPYWRDRHRLNCFFNALSDAQSPRLIRQQHRRSWREVPGRVSGQPQWFQGEFGWKFLQPQRCWNPVRCSEVCAGRL